jgi:hypothetical protein
MLMDRFCVINPVIPFLSLGEIPTSHWDVPPWSLEHAKFLAQKKPSQVLFYPRGWKTGLSKFLFDEKLEPAVFLQVTQPQD